MVFMFFHAGGIIQLHFIINNNRLQLLFKTVTVLGERIIDYLVSRSHVRSKAVEGRLFKHNTSLFGERKTLARDVFIHCS